MKPFFYTISCLILLNACTKVITVDIPDPKEEIVVEGFIEPNQPPFVTLTRNQPYFGGFDLNDIESYFVHDARVIISSGNDSVELTEWCVDDFDEEYQHEIAAALGYDFDDSLDVPNLCTYTIPDLYDYLIYGTAEFLGEIRKKYNLYIEAEGKVLTAHTTIPDLVPLDSLSFRPHADESKDSLVTLYCHFDEPDTLGNFLRYWTQRNSEPMYAPVAQSTFDDKLFNGQTFSLPLERGQDPQDDLDFDTYSYFWRGDTAVVKWSTIDKAHYDFWHTLESDGGDTPFSAPTRIKSNITGGIGIWGGYGTFLDTLYIPD